MQTESTVKQGKSTVFVVDNDPQDRAAVGDLVRQMKLRCLEYDLGQEFLDAYDPSWPGCLVVEVRLPDLGGLQIQRNLAERKATLPIIFLTAHANASAAVQAMRAGALQFFEKPFREHELWEAIQEAIALDLEIRREWEVEQELEERMAALTPKEVDVLEKIVDGKSNRAIAGELDVCVRTVELRRASLMNKLEVGSLMELLQLVGAAFVGASQRFGDYMRHQRIDSHPLLGRRHEGIGRRDGCGNGRKAML